MIMEQQKQIKVATTNDMTVQEIFNTPAIKNIELEILRRQHDMMNNRGHYDNPKDTISCLLATLSHSF
jgi:Tfp pilus assembly protein PilO